MTSSSIQRKEEWKCYPNALDPSTLNNSKSSRHPLKDTFPGWYRFIHEGDRVKIKIPGNTPATQRKEFICTAEVQNIFPGLILLRVESWSGFGTFPLTLDKCSKEKILWHASGVSSRILKRMRKYKKIQVQEVPAF